MFRKRYARYTVLTTTLPVLRQSAVINYPNVHYSPMENIYCFNFSILQLKFAISAQRIDPL